MDLPASPKSQKGATVIGHVVRKQDNLSLNQFNGSDINRVAGTKP